MRGADWIRAADRLADFRRDLSLVFDPDDRMWKDFGSPVPVLAQLANSDASDERLGPLLFKVVEAFDKSYVSLLATMLMPDLADDPVTSCAAVLISGSRVERTRDTQLLDGAWFAASGTSAGRLLGKNLTTFVRQLTQPYPDGRRLSQIQHLGRGLYLASLLALLLGPLAARHKSAIRTIDAVGAIVVWADTPPGPPDHPLVQAAARSFQQLVEKNRAGLAEALSASLASQRLPRRLPPIQRRPAALRAQFLAAGVTPSRVDAAIQTLSDGA